MATQYIRTLPETDLVIAPDATTGEVRIGSQPYYTRVLVPKLQANICAANTITGSVIEAGTIKVDNMISKSGDMINMSVGAARFKLGVDNGGIDLNSGVSKDFSICSNGTLFQNTGNIDIGVDPRSTGSQIILGSENNLGQLLFQNFSSQCNIDASGKAVLSSDKLVEMKSTDGTQSIIVSAEDSKIDIVSGGDTTINAAGDMTINAAGDITIGYDDTRINPIRLGSRNMLTFIDIKCGNTIVLDADILRLGADDKIYIGNMPSGATSAIIDMTTGGPITIQGDTTLLNNVTEINPSDSVPLFIGNNETTSAIEIGLQQSGTGSWLVLGTAPDREAIILIGNKSSSAITKIGGGNYCTLESDNDTYIEAGDNNTISSGNIINITAVNTVNISGSNYLSGTFIPSFLMDGVYTQLPGSGTYTRHGNLVTLTGEVSLQTNTSGNNTLYISDLPFTFIHEEMAIINSFKNELGNEDKVLSTKFNDQISLKSSVGQNRFNVKYWNATGNGFDNVNGNLLNDLVGIHFSMTFQL